MSKELYKILLSKNTNAQVTVAIEELAELQKELTKFLRGKHERTNILEEYVDVSIMLEQLQLLFNFKKREIEKIKDLKIKRIEERMKNDSL